MKSRFTPAAISESEIWSRDAFSFQEALRHSGDIVYRFDVKNMKFDYVSESVADIFGFPPQELLVLSAADTLDRFHPDDLDCLRQTWKRMKYMRQTEDAVFSIEYRIRDRDGKYRWHSDKWVVLRDEVGHPKYIIGCARDISAQKEDEEKLREANDRLQSVMDNIEEDVNVIAPDGTVLWHNEDLRGSGKIYQGQKCWKVFEGRQERCAHCVHPAILADGKPRDYEGHTPGRGGGAPRVWLVRAVPMRNEKNEIYAILETAIDITEKKKQEKERFEFESNLRQVQKLESLGIMAGGIAHDFNNILASILGNASLVLSDLPEDSPFVQSLSEIEAAARRASKICHQMLVYSGRGFPNIAAVNLNRVVFEISSLLKVTISKRITLKYELKEPLASIMADTTQISQIIMNLLTNAAEAIGDREGHICFSTGEMECNRSWFQGAHLPQDIVPGRYVFMEVKDTGCGMREETLHRMFDPFFTTKFTGRGLGMAVVLGIVRNHKGAIKVESAPGAGTVFRVVFPLSDEVSENIRESPNVIPPKIGAGTVLLVEDEDAVRLVCKRMLERGGFKVLPAENGRRGIELFRLHENEIGCVILDYSMPDMTGEEVFLVLKKINPDVRVLLSSGYSDLAFDRLTGMGVTGFLDKPYEYSTLIDEVLAVQNSASGVSTIKRR
ncbi:MAG: ATP-binding protein [Victivallales bacterium]